MSEQQRKLATILAVDLAGYSRAAEADEAGAAASIQRLRSVIDAVIEPLDGRIFNTAGDGFMIELPTASAGVEAASRLLISEDAPPVRIGVHMGEVILADGGDLLGHGVNVAARLQSLAEPGTAIVSHAVRAQIHTAQIELTSLGNVQLDKMHERMEVYALAPNRKPRFARVAWRRARRAIVGVLVLAVIVAGGSALWGAFGPDNTAQPPRLAVLRFESLGATEPYFAEGVADELIGELAGVQGLDVIARASSFSLTGQGATPANAARELGASIVLTGSVRQEGERVRVNAQLSEAPSGRQLWFETFDRPADEIFLLQRDIAVAVAVASGVRISAPPPRRVDARAYDLYARGRLEEIRDTQAGVRNALSLYREAVRRDPQFSAAWTALARAGVNDAYNRWLYSPPGAVVDQSWLAEPLEAAARASQLNPSSPEPYEVRASVARFVGDWTALSANLNEAHTRGGGAGVGPLFLGQVRRANESLRRRAELDPLSPGAWYSLGAVCDISGDFECSREASERAYRLAPDSPFGLLEYALALHLTGRDSEALQLTRGREELWRQAFAVNAPWTMGRLRAVFGEGRSPSTAELMQSVTSGEGNIDVAVEILELLGRADEVGPLLDHWTSSSRPQLFVLFSTGLRPARETPQFWALMEREGLLAFWRETEEWPDFCASERVCEAYRR